MLLTCLFSQLHRVVTVSDTSTWIGFPPLVHAHQLTSCYPQFHQTFFLPLFPTIFIFITPSRFSLISHKIPDIMYEILIVYE